MVKIRYFRIRLPDGIGLLGLAELAQKGTLPISVMRSSENELVVTFTTTRELRTVQYMPDGSSVPGIVTTMDQYSVRLFRSGTLYFLSLLDPPRSGRIVTDLLDGLLLNQKYFIEPLEFGRPFIERHVAVFDSVRLVSAKVRDFQIYEKTIARLEITSKEGIPDEIAPFLSGKFHRIDSMTYEVNHQFKKGLINYSTNGTVRISAPLVEIGFQSFELQL
ncbi:hypothetical protein [Rhodoferax sp.]|uniref:hypothetical protein n=1 Tax=Rhodoferax sp. TaxID=50421 RepID=UPI00374DE6CE